jgi:deoxyribodipyrimidine photo-lyase
MSDLPLPTRDAGLARLAAFAPLMGRAYAERRNADPGPGRRTVSGLSAHVRHRLVTERELAEAALAAHGPEAAAKFLDEVAWRTYWKGWLELRPAVWNAYRRELETDLARHHGSPSYRAACEGRTGIACFDAWAAELAATGWLHNHARMWFASIWIFTLRLPWTLGAALFLARLADGDPASNTLSWRWVAGIQTPGKHYVARAANIARWTEGRFDPRGELEEDPPPVAAPPPPPPRALPPADPWPPGRFGWLLHADDLWQAAPAPPAPPAALAGLMLPGAHPFTTAALEGVLDGAGPALAPEAVADWARQERLDAVATPWAPVGPVAEALAALRPALGAAGIALHRVRRDWDTRAWPLATRGFFPFREKALSLLLG